MRFLLWFLVGVAAAAPAGEPAPVDAIQSIAWAFDRYPVVAIGETHWLKEAGDFYASLVRDKGFQAKVNCIVIEFGSRRSQPVVDRYINGEDVPQTELQQVWRNTTKVFSWESPIYPRLLAAVREVNQSLPAARRLRVLAGDSPIDWTKVRTQEQWASYQPNNLSFAEVIVKEILGKKRKGLVILGSNHVTKGGDRDRVPDTTTLVEEKHPGSVYVILMHETKQPMWKVPALIPIAGTWLSAVSFGKRKLGDAGDAILYLGPSLNRADPDWDSYTRDPDYLKELDRRARIEWGCGFDLDWFRHGRRPCSEK
jgi:hypothetical protein